MIVQAVANSFGQLAGSMAPPVAFYLRRRTGSWLHSGLTWGANSTMVQKDKRGVRQNLLARCR
jgi:hypothetical protein